jgi:hypothetical protein
MDADLPAANFQGMDIFHVVQYPAAVITLPLRNDSERARKLLLC